MAFAYDDNGNMVQKTLGADVTNFVYNLEDRLEQVKDGSDNVIGSYYYDPFGRRLWKDVGGARTYFLYADEGLIGEYDGTGQEIKTYGWKPGSTWSTDPLFMKEGGEHYFYHNDHLGTPQKMISVTGATVWSAIYSSFGKAQVVPTSTLESNLRFPGQYEDAETGLHYNYYRYYQPLIGRYSRIDPLLRPFFFRNRIVYYIERIISKPQELSPYIYVVQKPLVKRDQLGLGIFSSYCCQKFVGQIMEGRKKCMEELEECYKKEDEFICDIQFHEKYTNHPSFSSAFSNCVCYRVGGDNWDQGKKKCSKGFSSCVKWAINMPTSNHFSK